MNQPGRKLNPLYFGLILALLSLSAFLYLGVYFLILLIPLMVYYLWSLHQRIRRLERKLEQPPPPPVGNPQA